MIPSARSDAAIAGLLAGTATLGLTAAVALAVLAARSPSGSALLVVASGANLTGALALGAAAALLARGRQVGNVATAPSRRDLRASMESASTSLGRSLLDLSADAPRLLLYSGPADSDAARESLARLRGLRARIEEHGASLVFVLECEAAGARRQLTAAGLDDAVHVADPTGRLRREFGLDRSATGAFLVFDGDVLREHRGRDASDHPDYLSFSRVRIRSERWIRS